MKYLMCDEVKCDHYEFVAEMSKNLIGKPCPKCGANLLTKEDYRLGVIVSRVIKVLKFLRLAKDIPLEGDVDPKSVMAVGVHDGKWLVKKMEEWE